jgi:hypothetical protein
MLQNIQKTVKLTVKQVKRLVQAMPTLALTSLVVGLMVAQLTVYSNWNGMFHDLGIYVADVFASESFK